MRHAAKLSETLSSINQAIWVAHSYKQEYKSAHRTASSYAVPGSTRYRQNASPHHHHHHLDHHTTRTDVVCSSTPWTRSVCSFCYCRVRPVAASQLTISRGLTLLALLLLLLLLLLLCTAVRKVKISSSRNLSAVAGLWVFSAGPVRFLFSHHTRNLAVNRQVGRAVVEKSPFSLHLAASAGRMLSGVRRGRAALS